MAESLQAGIPFTDVYMQRLAKDGLPYWLTGGIMVPDASGKQTEPKVSRDYHDNAIIVWRDSRGKGARPHRSLVFPGLS